MENFAGAIGGLGNFNLMQNALDFKLEQSYPGYRFHSCRSARGKMLQEVFFFFFWTNKDRLQLFCCKPVLCYQCVE